MSKLIPTDRTILVDVDEVILQWTPTFDQFLLDHHGIERPVEARSIHTFEWLGMETAVKFAREFNTNPQHFENLPAWEDAARVLPILVEEGWSFVAITAAGRCENAMEMRRKNLLKEFGDVFTDIHHVNFTEGKDCWLEKYSPTWWVDDSWSHVMSGLRHNHSSIHMVRLHDRALSHPEVKKAHSWDEIREIINGRPTQ